MHTTSKAVNWRGFTSRHFQCSKRILVRGVELHATEIGSWTYAHWKDVGRNVISHLISRWRHWRLYRPALYYLLSTFLRYWRFSIFRTQLSCRSGELESCQNLNSWWVAAQYCIWQSCWNSDNFSYTCHVIEHFYLVGYLRIVTF